MKGKRIIVAAIAALFMLAACNRSHSTAHEDGAQQTDSLLIQVREHADYERLLLLADSLEDAGLISEMRADYLRGEANAYLHQPRAAAYYLKRAVEAGIEQAENPHDYFRAAASLAGILVNRSDYEGALQAALPAVEALERQQAEPGIDLCVLLEAIGRCQLSLDHDDEAAESYERAYRCYMQLAAADAADSESLRHAVIGTYNTALSYLTANHYREAWQWIDRTDSVLQRYAKAPAASQPFVAQVHALATLQRATAEQGLGRTAEAARDYHAYLATDYGQTDGGRIDATKYLVAARRYAEAADNYQALDHVLADWGYDLSMNNVQGFLFPKFRANAGAGRTDSAVAVGMQILNALDTAILRSKTDDAAELATIYDTQRKEGEIARQQVELAGKDAALSQQRWVGTALALVLITAFFVVYTLIRRRAARSLAEKNRQLQLANARAEESSKMKTAFIQQISHEIRTPLNILSGFSQVLTDGGDALSADERNEINHQITENTERITSLVRKMLELSDASSRTVIERRDSLSARALATQAAEMSGVDAMADIDFCLLLPDDGADMPLLTDQESATRALTLLLDNAVKFQLPPKGTDDPQAPHPSPDHRPTVRLRLMLHGDRAVFAVEDTGKGIPAAEAEHIFDEFVQLDDYYDGTGIGLTVARSLARRLGGDIVLDTTYTPGARFLLSLPGGQQ